MNNASATTRFRGPVASSRAVHVAGALVVVGLAALAVGGLAASIPAIAFLAAGAGAGYSLSGSV